MIPGGSETILLEVAERPSLTFAVDMENNKIVGQIDGLEAAKQAAFLALGVERFDHEIFSWNYGFENKKIIGRQMSLAIPETERYITECLLQDDRFLEVKDFVFTQDKSKLLVEFEVVTKAGSFFVEKEVSL